MPSAATWPRSVAAPFTNVKFDSYKSVPNQSISAQDLLLMRVEEMYLIKAEALAMSGQAAEGAKVLTDFVKTYRDPAYTLTATTPEAVQEAVWMQRRVELWGEGFSYFDLLRLGQRHRPSRLRFPAGSQTITSRPTPP